MGQKILKASYFWPLLLKNVHIYVKKYDACQRYARYDLRMGLLSHVSFPLIFFEKLGINYIGKVHPHLS